jgi:phage-related protein
MAVVVPIVSEWNPKGVNRSLADIKKAEGGWAKTGAAFKSALVPATAALGAVGFAAFSAGKDAEEARKANARLSAVFDSIGYPQLASDAQDFADALALQIGVDDEIIKAGQAKLATFSEVAKSSETMARATGLAADLAATGFGDISSSSTMLGKALQDPVKGMSALGRAGVTFTAQQKKQVKAMVEAGDAAGAQALILGEVEKQVGGVAKASASTTDKMAVQWGELKETFGESALPIMDALLPALEAVSGWITRNKALFIGLTVTIAGLAAAVVVVNAAMAVWSAGLVAFGVIQSVTKAVKAWTVVQWLLNASLWANPIVLIVAGIVALIAVIVVAYKKSETFRRIVDGAFRAVLGAAKTAWEWIKRNWPLLLAILTGPFGLLVLAVVKNKDRIMALLESFVGWIKRAWTGALDPAKQAFQSLYDFVARIVDRIKRIWDSVSGIIDKVNPFASGISVSSTGTVVQPFAAASSGRTTTTAGVTVNVYGAIDPDATGRKIRQILSDTENRLGSRRPRLVL